jgi:hypothetical protein
LLKEGSGYAATLSMRAPLGKPGGGSFARGPVGCERKALGMGISLYGGSVGQPGEGPSTRDLQIWLKGALEGRLACWGPLRIGRKWALGVGRLSVNRPTAEGLEGGILYWGPWVIKGRFCGRASLFVGLSWATWSGLVYRGL